MKANVTGPHMSSHLLLTISLGMALVSLEVSIVNVALDDIRTRLTASLSEMQWIVNAYTLAFAGALISAGGLGDRYGARRIFTAGLYIFMVSSLLCAVANSSSLLILARVIQGVGAALIASNSLALLTHGYESSADRSRAVGIWGATGGIALASGPVVGGILVTGMDWRAVFLINLPICVLILWFTSRHTYETPAIHRALDWPGQILVVIALVSGTAFLIEGEHGGWGAASTALLALPIAFVCASAAFMWVEARSTSPMVPLGLFANPTYSFMAVAAFLVTSGFFGMVFVLSLYFQRVLGMSPFEAGLAFLPMTGLIAVANLLAGRIAGRWGVTTPIFVGLAAALLGYASFAVLLSHQTLYSDIWLTLVFSGAGLALVTPPMISLMMTSVERQYVGVASGVLNTVRQTGGAFGVAVHGALSLGGTSVPGIRIALFVTAVGLLAALVCAYLSVLSGKPAAGRS